MFKKFVLIVMSALLLCVLVASTVKADPQPYKPPYTWAFIEVAIKCTPVGGYGQAPNKFVMLSNVFSFCMNEVNLDGLYQMAAGDVDTYGKGNCVGSIEVISGIARGPYGSQAIAVTKKAETVAYAGSRSVPVKDMYMSASVYSNKCQ